MVLVLSCLPGAAGKSIPSHLPTIGKLLTFKDLDRRYGGEMFRLLQTKAAPKSTKAAASFRQDRGQHKPYTFALPPLPVPPLKQTLDKYYRSLVPLLSEGELKHTKKLLNNFVAPEGEGAYLQEMLVRRASEYENWLRRRLFRRVPEFYRYVPNGIWENVTYFMAREYCLATFRGRFNLEDWWLHRGYLEYRPPLPVNISPGIVFPPMHYSDQEGQLRTAAALIIHILEFREMVNSGQLEPDNVKGRPQDMSQYLKVFGSYRVPGGTHDEILIGEENVQRPFMIVMHRNSVFQIPVQDESGRPLSQYEFFLYLLSAVKQAETHPPVAVGILTSQNRSAWSHAYKQLQRNKSNRHVLDLIQKSLFVLCLDTPMPNNGKKSSKIADAGRQVLHGGGSQANSGNRWFDKTLQVIVGADGVCGWNYEHTLIEGPPLFRMMDYVVKQMGTGQHMNSAHPSPAPKSKYANPVDAKHLPFDVDKVIVAEIDAAANLMDTHVADVDLNVLEFTDYGKNYIKSRKLSPDSYFQMAIQLAFYRLYNQIPATYESASTRQFAHGRTETIRSASDESSKFVKAMIGKAGVKTIQKLLREAVAAHKMYTADASNGNGVDRHLMGLKLTAVENGRNIPEFLMDIGYTTSTHWKLSTSQGSTDLRAYMCYGPAVADGFGCCYNPRADDIIAGFTARHSFAGTNSAMFTEVVGDSLRDMKTIMDQ